MMYPLFLLDLQAHRSAYHCLTLTSPNMTIMEKSAGLFGLSGLSDKDSSVIVIDVSQLKWFNDPTPRNMKKNFWTSFA